MKYPKIETLYKRDDKFKVTTELRCSEFGLIREWLIQEKVDGTNTRIMLFPDGHVEWRGRTDRAQFHPKLWDYLQTTFTEAKMQVTFEQEIGEWPLVILYGESYGPKIQSGGKYRADVTLRLFDVKVGDWWLNWENVEDVAEKLGIETVPVLGIRRDWIPTCRAELEDLFQWEGTDNPPCHSIVAFEDHGSTDCAPEGIVARTNPLLFDRRGNRVMWKLKFRDFEK